MTNKFDWNAPVEPGFGMFGLSLGLSLDTVRSMLGDTGNIVANSPRLKVDYKSSQLALLRAMDTPDCQYDWQNIMARMMFEDGTLSGIRADRNLGGEAYAYKGKLFNKIGLGSLVSDLLDFGNFEYDDVEEVFYSEQWRGVEIGGSGACDLSTNPGQVITTFMVYRTK
jgi:hypothetical protein